MKLKIILIALVAFLFSLGSANAWTHHKFRAEPSPDGSWRVISMPKEVMDSDEFHHDYHNRSMIWGCRDKGIWDEPIIVVKTMYSVDDVNKFTAKYNDFIKTIDQILPDEEIVSLCFWIDYDEFLVYFHPDKWKDKGFHENAARLMNIHREDFYNTN